jgi:hypothetical protein
MTISKSKKQTCVLYNEYLVKTTNKLVQCQEIWKISGNTRRCISNDENFCDV